MNWSASNYRRKRAERLKLSAARWVTLPSGERFYLRPVNAAMGSLLAGCLPSSLTEMAAQAWKEKGVAGLGDVKAQIAAKMDAEQIAEGLRRTKRLSGIIQQNCVIPLLSNEPPDRVEFAEDWKAEAIEGLRVLDSSFDPATFNPKELVLDPRDLANEDAEWLFSWASGMVADVELKGGGAVQMDDLSRFRKKPGRRSRVGPDGAKLRQAS